MRSKRFYQRGPRMIWEIWGHVLLRDTHKQHVTKQDTTPDTCISRKNCKTKYQPYFLMYQGKWKICIRAYFLMPDIRPDTSCINLIQFSACICLISWYSIRSKLCISMGIFFFTLILTTLWKKHCCGDPKTCFGVAIKVWFSQIVQKVRLLGYLT